MPIYTSEVKKDKLSYSALSGNTFDTTNFTQLEQGSTRLDVGTESNNITVNGSTVNPFYFLKFFTHYGDPGSFVYSALLINRAVQPGEEVTISGYFFRGSDPNTDNNNEAATPIAIVYETNVLNMTDFKTKPASDAYNIGTGGLTDADIIGQGIVPASNGTNVGALNNGWKYNTTGRSAVAETQARNIGNTGDQTDATLCPFNLSAEGEFGSRFYTITIRNDTSSEAFLKILGWDITDAGLDSSKVFSVHDLRVEFDNEITNAVIKAKGISGETDSPLTIRADKNINFKIDHDADDTAKFSFVAGDNTEVANIDESGNLQMDGDLTVSGDQITFGSNATIVNTDANTLTVTEANVAVAGNFSVSGAITGDTNTFTSANANDPLVIIKNTTNDANSARLQFVKDKGAAGADGDDIGSIEFISDDAGQNQTPFAKIVAEVSTAAETDEAGKLSLFVAESNGTTTTLTAGLVLEGEHATDGEVDVTIGAGAASLTTVAGDLTVSGDQITFGSGATIVNTDANTLTVTEATTVLSGDLTVSGDQITFGSNATIVNTDANTLTVTEANVAVAGNFSVSGDITGDTNTFTSANADDPLIIIENTTNDANGARLRFVKDKGAAGSADDVAGIIEFYADDAAQDQVKFGEIKSQVYVHTNDQEGGKLTLSVASHDGELRYGIIVKDGSVEDEVDVTIGSGAASLISMEGNLAVAGTIRGKQIEIRDMGADIATTDHHWLPASTLHHGASAGSTSWSAYFFMAPYAGKLLKVYVKPESATSWIYVRLYEITQVLGGTMPAPDGVGTTKRGEGFWGSQANTFSSVTFDEVLDSGDDLGVDLVAGKIYGISIDEDGDGNNPNFVMVTGIFEWDFTDI